MADTFTPTLNMTKPEIDASAETWGQKLNADLDLLDAFATNTNNWIAAQPGNVNNQIWAAINAILPRGVIMAWAGNTWQVPSGWLLCNGLNGTPNLQDRFILGTAGARNPWEAGGSFSSGAATDTQGWHSHGGGTHGHALTVNEMPAHSHGGWTDAQGWHDHSVPTQGDLGAAAGGYPVPVDKNYQHRGQRTDGNGSHSHNVGTYNVGADWGHSHGLNGDGNHAHNVSVSVVPPYFALCYIMRA